MDCRWSDLIRLDEEPDVSVDVVEEIGDVGSNNKPVEQEVCDVLGSSQAIECYGGVDWDRLQIADTFDEEGEGVLDIIDEDPLFCLLGLRTDDDQHDRPSEAEAQAAAKRDSTFENRTADIDIDTTGAAIPVDDHVPGERLYAYDPNKPCMDIGTVYPNMKEFRLAMKQFAINEEFEFHLVKTDKKRYIADCANDDCPWHINGRTQPDGTTVKVTALIALHTCTSSVRRKTTTPPAAWVASKAIHHLRKDSTIGAISMQKLLQDEHKCQIHCDTVWKGRQIAMEELFGSWQQSFQMLFNWRAEVLHRSRGSIIEIDIKQVDGQLYFHRYFCALSPCIEGFLEDCRPYISIDSTTFNGRWNGHMATATAIDGHNWMYPLAFGYIDGETIDNWTWFDSAA